MNEVAEALKDLLTPVTFLAFILLLLPGTISIRTYDRLRARRPRKVTESIIDVIIASIVTDLFWVRLFDPLKQDVEKTHFPDFLGACLFFFAFLVTPALLAIIYNVFEGQLSKLGIVSDAEPRPWDKWFQKIKHDKLILGVILVMRSDKRAIAGKFVPPGFASSAPAEESLHIGEMWEYDRDKGFVRPISGSLGIYVRMADIETIEFLDWSEIEKSLEESTNGGQREKQ